MEEKEGMIFKLNWSVIVTNLRFSDLFLAMLALFIYSAVVQRLTNKGPMLWPVMGIVPTLLYNIKDVYNWATDIMTKCGGTIYHKMTWMDDIQGIVTADPSIVEYMLKTRFNNFPKGNFFRERFHDLLGDGIFNADDEIWKEQRQAANSQMHTSQFMEYSYQTIQALVHEKLLKVINKLANSSEMIDLQDLLLRFTFDNICVTAFGVDPGCLAIDLPDIPFAKAFEKAAEVTLYRFLLPPFIWKTMKFLGVGSEKQLKEAVGIVNEFAVMTVSDRRIECCKFGSLNNRFDLLSRLIMLKDLDDEQGKIYKFGDKFLIDFCISFILAGRDTSSVALAWFFWLIHEHPHVGNQILNEIKEIMRNRKSSLEDVNQIVFTVDDLKNMVYLEAALSESLRLYPSVPNDMKEVKEDDMFPNGMVVNKGDKIIYSAYAMARMESIWGKDCREFKPQRWIKDGKLVSESQFKYVVFNGGPRLCVGKKFAYMQMKMVAASILLRYSVKVIEGQTVIPKLATTLYMKNGLSVSFEPRLRP